jgi:hypothetical protein
MKTSNVLKKKHNTKAMEEPNFMANYQILLANENQDSPYFPTENFLDIARTYWGKSKSIEDFVNGLNNFVLDNFVYEMADGKESGYYLRNANEAYNERKAICSERAFFLIAISRIAGIDSSFGVTSHRSNYEHGVLIASLDGGTLAIESCGKLNKHQTGYIAIPSNNLKNAYKEWRHGHFSMTLG